MSASAVLKLQKVGFTSEQVEALADFMDTQAASKADLMRETSTIRGDLVGVRAELKADIADVRAELGATKADLKSDLKLLEQRMTIRLGGMLVVITGILLAAMRYMIVPHP
jgi:hypothetical protein